MAFALSSSFKEMYGFQFVALSFWINVILLNWGSVFAIRRFEIKPYLIQGFSLGDVSECLCVASEFYDCKAYFHFFLGCIVYCVFSYSHSFPVSHSDPLIDVFDCVHVLDSLVILSIGPSG